MIHLIPAIKPNELDPDFKLIYSDSFPPDERRDWQQLLDLIKNPLFSLNQIYIPNQFIGFITSWKLSGFIFIEHFAIHQKQRGKGFGSEVINQILQLESTPAILETEEPNSDEARRRIRFYEGLNFKVNSGEYYQPPYSIGKNTVKMLLMSFPDELHKIEFDQIKTQIYQVVYQHQQD